MIRTPIPKQAVGASVAPQRTEGRGEVCLPDASGVSVGREVGPSSLPTNQSSGDVSIADVLLRVGVFVLSKPRREALAAELQADGITGDDIDAMHAYLSSCINDEPGKVQRTLAARLMAKDERKDVIADLRKHLAGKLPKTSDEQQLAHGERIRQENVQRVRQFDADYEAWLRAKKAGQLPELERAVMPWERAGNISQRRES